MDTCCIVAKRSWDFSSTAFQLILTLVEISLILVSLYHDEIHRATRTFQILIGRHDTIGLIPCRAQQQQFSDALDALYFRGVGRNTSRHVRIWHRLKEMIGRADWFLVILSSKYIFEDKMTSLTNYFFQCGIMGVFPCLTSFSALMFGFDNGNLYLLVLRISMLYC